MILLALLLLFALLSLIYLLFEGELLSPSFLTCGMYFFSMFIALIYSEKWNFDLNLETFLVIFLAIIMIVLGEFLARKVKFQRYKQAFIPEVNRIINISKVYTLSCLAFVIFAGIIYYRDTVEMIMSSTSNSAVFLMMVRDTKIYDDVNVSYLAQVCFTVSECIVDIIAYRIIYNKIYFNKLSKSVFQYLIIIVYLAVSLLTSGRAKILNFAIYVIMLLLLLHYKKTNWSRRHNFKLVLRSLLVTCLAILAFYGAGFLTEKSLHYDNFFDNFSNYFSSSIYALNEYIEKNGVDTNTHFFGIYTLSGIFVGLRKLGFIIPDSIISLEYIYCGDYLTNIYTPLRRYIQDFGLIGMSIILFFIGYLYTKLLNCAKKGTSSGIYVIFWAYFSFPLLYMSIEERVFMDVIMFRSLQTIVIMYVLYRIMILQNVKLVLKK